MVDLIPAGPRLRRLVAEIMGAAAETAAVRQVEHPTEATPEADRTAVLPVAGTVTTKKFLPRFTPHLTHRQEAP